MYIISDGTYQPVIIDFGLSSAKISGKFTGVTDMKWTFNKISPVYDLYKFMVFSMREALNANNYDNNKKLLGNIHSLFQIFGDLDPYKIYKSGDINKPVRDHCLQVIKTNISHISPLLVLQNIVLPSNITVKKRDLLLPINYSSFEYEYFYILNDKFKGIDRALNLSKKCININNSYIMSIYTYIITENYINSIKKGKTKISNLLTNIYSLIQRNKDKMIKYDMMLFEGFTDTDFNIDTRMDDYKKIVNKVKKSWLPFFNKLEIQIYNEITDFESKYNGYIQMYYIILELGMESIYSSWLEIFTRSNVFKIYTENYVYLTMVKRWCEILIN